VAGVRYTHAARADLLSIGDFTLDTFGPVQYDVYMDGLAAYCQQLAATPVLGRPHKPPYQWSRYVSHVVYFRRKDDADIVVVRILHKSMLPELHLDPSRDDEPDDDQDE
jgi:plasmid stabilization system protein ParE